MTCDLRANLPGYQSDQINLTDRRVLDHTDVGVILLHRTFAVHGAAVSSTSLKAPKKARDAYQSGLKSQRAGKVDGALKEFQKAVAAYPEYADAWLELGRVQQKLGSAQLARDAWKKALELDPKLTAAYMELGLDAGLSHNWKLATGYLDQGLRLDPVNHPEAWFGDAVAHYYLGDFEASEKSAREAVRLDSEGRNPRAGYVLGMALERKGDREGAAAELRRYLKTAPQAADAETVKAHLAALENKGRQVDGPAK